MTSVHTTSARATGTVGSHPYTCNSCQVAYRNNDLQKNHMKSDWHRYNLKRRVASLPPISTEVFTEKVLSARAASSAEANKAYFERSCGTCNKTYYSQNAYQNHLSSQKHKLNDLAGASAQDDEIRSSVSSTFSLGDPCVVPNSIVGSDIEVDFNQVIDTLQKSKVPKQCSPSSKSPQASAKIKTGPETNAENNTSSIGIGSAAKDPDLNAQSCIFCNYESPTVALNTHHMERFHGMFVPEKPYLTDLEGLIKHLQNQVAKYHQCLFCRKVTTSIFGIQTHMRDKGHCKIPYATEEDQLMIGDFYDFRSTYSDDQETESVNYSEEEQQGLKYPHTLVQSKDYSDRTLAGEGEREDADGWETDSSESSLDSADLTAVPAEGHIHQIERLSQHHHHSHHDPRQRHQVDGWHSHAHKHTHAAFYDDYELHLPSGKSVGHRSLNRYYRQNLHNYPTPEEKTLRQAIEASGSDDMDSDGEGRVTLRKGHDHKVVPRGEKGLAGVSEEKKRRVRNSLQRGRDLEQSRTKRNDMAYGTRLNNHKSYYYRFQGGG